MYTSKCVEQTAMSELGIFLHDVHKKFCFTIMYQFVIHRRWRPASRHIKVNIGGGGTQRGINTQDSLLNKVFLKMFASDFLVEWQKSETHRCK